MSQLAGAFARVDRAGEHLANLKQRVDSYLAEHRPEFEIRVVPGANIHTTYQITSQPTANPEDLPPLIGILIGETVQNLRTALDYLVYELAVWYSGRNPTRRTQFPIENTPNGFKGRVDTYLEGVLEEHVTAIKGLQPFKERNWLWHIREISNTDKHNVVTPTLFAGEGWVYSGTDATTATLGGGYAKPHDPVGVYFKFPMSIAVKQTDESRPPDGPVVQLLEDLLAQTRGLLEMFEPIFETTPPPRVIASHPRSRSRKRRKRNRR